jgi:hypothetical protein
MALSDSDRMQMVSMALMRHSVITTGTALSLISQTKCAINKIPDAAQFIHPHESLFANEHISVPAYSYLIS